MTDHIEIDLASLIPHEARLHRVMVVHDASDIDLNAYTGFTTNAQVRNLHNLRRLSLYIGDYVTALFSVDDTGVGDYHFHVFQSDIVFKTLLNVTTLVEQYAKTNHADDRIPVNRKIPEHRSDEYPAAVGIAAMLDGTLTDVVTVEAFALITPKRRLRIDRQKGG